MSTHSNIDELIERYYDASISEQEEQTLIALLFGPYADNQRYDEHRAALSFTLMGKRLLNEKKRTESARTFHIYNYKSTLGAVASIAACLIIVLNIGLFTKSNQDDYIMVRHGEKYYTSTEMAESEMKLALANVLEDCPSIEEELGNIFADFEN